MTRKRAVYFEPVDHVRHSSAIVLYFLVKKKEDHGSFKISCTVRFFNFAKSLHDLGASINLMSLVVYSQLELGFPKPTLMRFLIEDQTIKNLVWLLCDVSIRLSILHLSK